MKHVWILNHYAQEPSGAGGTRHFSLARHLMSYGWKASVVAASVELNTGRQRLLDGEQKRLEDCSGVRFCWIRTPQYKGNGIGRIINMLTFAFRSLLSKYTRELEKPDAIIGSSVHPFTAVAGAILSRRFKVPFVFEVRDLWPQTLVDLGRLSDKSIITRFLRLLEKWLYQRADRIIVLLPNAGDYITPFGITQDKIVWIPNGVELEGNPEPEKPVESALFTLMYFGAHGQANGLSNVLKAMAELQKKSYTKHIRLRLIGDGPIKPALLQQAKELGLNNVEFESPVPKKQIPALASEADAFVFNLIDTPVFKFGISSNKLFDYLAGARPIIFSCLSSNNPIEDAQAGITVPPDNPELLAEAIVTLAEMSSDDRATMGHAGRVYVEQHYSFDVLAARLAAMLDDVIIKH
ncbi:glycosyltransferase family 4 protein [uncultured Endozoicomonas sp.]|uniref:glycosyltransferase family 4 protein n=1 Tax=uncultured Endozoicomonas sp. TaxID=432652 RepID=UPI002635AE58|nr:glycosyltransferase family 4 protein [uncultured Endozoicomonas sp.]